MKKEEFFENTIKTLELMSQALEEHKAKIIELEERIEELEEQMEIDEDDEEDETEDDDCCFEPTSFIVHFSRRDDQ